jgi:hypothetical protein
VFDLFHHHQDTQVMQTINRMAAIVTPSAPFFEWSESVLGEESKECGPEDFRTVFLLPERNNIDNSLQTVYGDIFSEMLLASVNAPGLWPDKRDLRTFRKWFKIELVEMVFDAGSGELLHDLP